MVCKLQSADCDHAMCQGVHSALISANMTCNFMFAGARPVGGARNRGVRARRAKAASCCIDSQLLHRLFGNVPKINLAGQTAEHSVV